MQACEDDGLRETVLLRRQNFAASGFMALQGFDKYQLRTEKQMDTEFLLRLPNLPFPEYSWSSWVSS